MAPRATSPRTGALTGDRGARSLLATYATEVCYVPVSDPGVTLDVDTPLETSVDTKKGPA